MRLSILAAVVLTVVLGFQSTAQAQCSNGKCGLPSFQTAPASCPCGTSCPAGGGCTSGQCGQAGCVSGYTSRGCSSGCCGRRPVFRAVRHRLFHPFRRR